MKNNKMIVKTTSIILAVILSLCPLSLCYADDELEIPEMPTPDVLWREAGCEMLWLLLQAWGIDLVTDLSLEEVEEFSDTIYDTVTDLVIEYLSQLPSPMSIISWTQLWAWGSDFWGNFRYNSSMLEDVQSFADWLITKYNLGSYDHAPINPVVTLGEYPLFLTGEWYTACNLDGSPSAEYIGLGTFDISGFDYQYYTQIYNGSNWYFVFINPKSAPIDGGSFRIRKLAANGTESNMITGSTGSSPTSGQYIFWQRAAINLSEIRIAGDNYFVGNYDQMSNYLSTAQIVFDGAVYLKTGTINLPVNDPSYTSGDGVVVVDGKPEYQEVSVVNPISVSNLPAIVSTGTISNLDVSSVTLPFNSFINTMSDGLELMTDIIYNFPSPIVAFALAIISATIVFGVIKVLKEH